MFSRKKHLTAILVWMCGCLVRLEAYKDADEAIEYDIPIAPEDGPIRIPSFANNDPGSHKYQFMKSSGFLLPQFEPDPPETSDVPKEEMEYKFRVYATNCSCPQAKKQIDIKDKILKKIQHLPFGIPYSPADNVTLRVLYNEDYILAFDLKYRIPMWAAFTLQGRKDVSKLNDICWTGDARIAFSDTAQCGDYDTTIVKKQNILQRPLFPPDFSDSFVKNQAAYITNSIPKSLNHTKILENELYQILAEWAARDNQLNVMMGPAFDLLGTGERPDIGTIMRTHQTHGPLIVPTHIFAVATWCSVRVDKINDCNPSKLMAHGFLLPNKPFAETAEPSAKTLQKSAARVADIEKLTGLSFYTGLPTYQATRLRTMELERTFSLVK